MCGPEIGDYCHSTRKGSKFDWETFDKESDTAIREYYQVLGQLSAKFACRRAVVEQIIVHTFSRPSLYIPQSFRQDLVIDVEEVLRIDRRELEKAVSRWASRLDGFVWFVTEQKLINYEPDTGVNHE